MPPGALVRGQAATSGEACMACSFPCLPPRSTVAQSTKTAASLNGAAHLVHEALDHALIREMRKRPPVQATRISVLHPAKEHHVHGSSRDHAQLARSCNLTSKLPGRHLESL
eukprot:758819-Hanusia_phi.AAC.4